MEKLQEELLDRIKHLEERISEKDFLIELLRFKANRLEQNAKDVTKRYTPKAEKCIYKILIPKN